MYRIIYKFERRLVKDNKSYLACKERTPKPRLGQGEFLRNLEIPPIGSNSADRTQDVICFSSQVAIIAQVSKLPFLNDCMEVKGSAKCVSKEAQCE